MASVYTQKLLHRDAFTHREAFTHSKLLHTKSFSHSKLSNTASVYTQNTYTQCFYTWQAFTHTASFLNREAFTHNKLLHRKALHSKLSHTASVYTQNTYTQCFYTWQAFTHTASFLNREAFTHNKLLHREAFTHSKLSHTASVYTQNTYAQCFYTWQAFTHTETFTQRRFYTQQAFTEKVFAQRSFLVHNHNRNCSSKTVSRRQSDNKTILKHFLKGILKGKLLALKLRKSADKSLSQPWCSHSNTIYDLQLQKTIVLCMQARHQATLTQPFQCDLQPRLQETHRTTHTGSTILALLIHMPICLFGVWKVFSLLCAMFCVAGTALLTWLKYVMCLTLVAGWADPRIAMEKGI